MNKRKRPIGRFLLFCPEWMHLNFLIINGAVLLPTYNSPKDNEAISQLRKAFPDREIVGINCLPLIKQHGSLHCVTMQYPEGFIKE